MTVFIHSLPLKNSETQLVYMNHELIPKNTRILRKEDKKNSKQSFKSKHWSNKNIALTSHKQQTHSPK